MKIFKFIFSAIILTAIVIVISFLDIWQNIEYKAQDMFFMFRGQQEISEKVVLIEISDDTFSSLQHQWPFPREYYAKLIDNLNKAGAKQIIFDITFSEDSEAISDSMLAEAAIKHGNVIFAGKIVQNDSQFFTKKQVVKPVVATSQQEIKWGIVNIPMDTDGFVRRYQLFEKIGTQKLYSLGVVAKATLSNEKNWQQDVVDRSRYFALKNTFIPKATSKTAFINYYGPAGTFKYYDFADVLDDKDFKLPNLDLDSFEQMQKDGIFEDKIVIVGTTSEELHDYFNTPFLTDNNKMTPRIEIHANFVEMLHNEDFLQEQHFVKFILILFILTIMILFINLVLKPLASLILDVILILVSIFIIYSLFVNQNLIMPILQIPLLIIIILIVGIVIHYLKVKRERAFIKNAFSKYMAPELVNELVKKPEKLEYSGKERELSVLFTNIRSFTSYAEKHNPKETTQILREYLNTITSIIKENKGIVDKYVGDEVVSLFGVPLDLPDHAFWACKAALEIREKVTELQQKWKTQRKDIIEIGCGINSGLAIVGNLGSDEIFDYTAIGDTINVGSRIEELNKTYETDNNIIISENTYKLVKDRIIAEFIEEVTVRGRSKPVAVYQLVGIKKELRKKEK
ncbi:MAG: adenylate/guanylate cyclase domain-containing protein [Candidatus Cloacimonadota bacterium]|nr:adenylate/guanylate cyclase domain-containing protein [Candidatus Cloacimonadota bacterium]